MANNPKIIELIKSTWKLQEKLLEAFSGKNSLITRNTSNFSYEFLNIVYRWTFSRLNTREIKYLIKSMQKKLRSITLTLRRGGLFMGRKNLSLIILMNA